MAVTGKAVCVEKQFIRKLTIVRKLIFLCVNSRFMKQHS